MPEQALIAGGGIGGLAAAIALSRRGIACEILERSHFAEETGAGIQLGPNATRTLQALGMLEAIEQDAFRPEAIVIYDGVSGRQLTAMPLDGAAERYGAPYLTLRRADLHAALRAALAGLASVTLRSGFALAAIDAQASDGVVARATDGSEAKGACLIGADGLWSGLRTIISPAASLRFAGATAWRAQVPRDTLPAPFAEPVVGLWLGPGTHLVHYPVGGGADLNLVAVTEDGAARQGWSQPGSTSDVIASFARWTSGAKDLLERVEGWRGWSLYRLTGLKNWTAGRLTLLGDAAHPVLPYLAQGAALAMEDAVAIAACLAERPSDPASAFRRYEDMRRPRAARMQRVSRRFGLLYHLGSPLAEARNLVLARRREETALRRFDWLYRDDHGNQ